MIIGINDTRSLPGTNTTAFSMFQDCLSTKVPWARQIVRLLLWAPRAGLRAERAARDRALLGGPPWVGSDTGRPATAKRARGG